MIQFNATICKAWNKKIIYAPNGFGKTTNAKNIKDHLKGLGENPLIFTRRDIENLVGTYENTIFFGETALNEKENSNLKTDYENSAALKEFFKKNYATNNIRKLKESSFYIQKTNIKKLNDFNEIYNTSITDIDDIYPITKDLCISIDKILNLNIYDNAKLLLGSKKEIKRIKTSKKYTMIDEDFMDNFDYLQDYAKSSTNNNCPLCGKRFSSKEKLLEAIEKKRKKYKTKDNNGLFNQLESITLKIHNLYFESEIKDKLYNFDETKLLTINGMIQLLSNYVGLCDNNVCYMSKYIGDVEITKSDTIKTLLIKYKNNEYKINSEKKNVTNIKLFTQFIIDELNKIIAVDDNIKFKAIPNRLAVKIIIDNIDEKTDLYNFLSESEIKRFCLVVLRALIKYGKHETLILDDPIDSYDDYYMLVACEYISKIVAESKLSNWYILTNNFTALTNLSSIIKCTSTIYYYVPDDIFTANNFTIDNFDVPYKEIEEVAKNELVLLSKYLNGKLNVNLDLAYISFIPTLRNFKEVVLKSYNRLFVKNGKEINKNPLQYNVDVTIQKDIEKIVEHNYMHYENDITGMNSNNIEVHQVAELYERLSKLDTTTFNKYLIDKRPLCSFRENVAKTKFNSLNGSKILNLILKKICIISYLKFEFEKLLLVTLENVYSFSATDISTIIKTNSLGKKLKESKRISKKNSYGAELFLNDYSEIFRTNSMLFNQFDHALEQMFPPYIATNVKDIKRFKNAIDNLKAKYQII